MLLCEYTVFMLGFQLVYVVPYYYLCSYNLVYHLLITGNDDMYFRQGRLQKFVAPE